MQDRLGAVNLNQITTELIDRILVKIQSGAPRSMLDLSWTIVMNPIQILGAHIGGRGGDGPPAWFKALKYKQTWYSWNLRGPLTCAAFCLANWLNDGGRHRSPTMIKYGPRPVPRALQQVRELQTQFHWGARVTMADLNVFTEAFPKYQLTLMRPNKTAPDASIIRVYTGLDYVVGSAKTDCYMISLNDHWALLNSINECIQQFKNGGAYKYCKVCARIVKYNSNLVAGTIKLIIDGRNSWPCHDAGVPERKVKMPAKCKIALCEGIIHTKSSACPYTKCKTCSMGFLSTVPHRCLVLPKSMDAEHPHNKYH